MDDKACVNIVSLKDWISCTLSQGYTCVFTHMLLFKQANAYKSTIPELTLQSDIAIIKVCQESGKNLVLYNTMAYLKAKQFE